MGCCRRCLLVLRQEFKLSNFCFDFCEPQRFVVSEWQKQPFVSVKPWYVLFRWFWALYHAGWWLTSLIYEGGLDAPIQRKAYHFIYLTNWAYLSIVVSTTVEASVVTNYWLRYRRTAQLPKTMTPALKVVWVLQSVVYLPALLITAAYWSVIYDPGFLELLQSMSTLGPNDPRPWYMAYPVTAINVEVHIVNSVYVLINLFVIAAPVRIFHFYVPLAFLFTYLIFTLIYWAAGGTTPEGDTAIYPIMDWDNLGLTVPFVVGCGVFSPAMQGIVWLIYRARLWARRSCCSCSPRASLPHQGTMDDIIGRDASMESVNPTTPRIAVIAQPV